MKRNNSSARENSDFVKLSLIYFACAQSKNLLVSLISLTRFQSLPAVWESNGSFWIFVMSISLFTSRSLNATTLALPHSYLAEIITCLNLILSPVTTILKFFRTIENFLTFAWDFGTGVLCATFRLSSAPYIFRKYTSRVCHTILRDALRF